MKVTTEIQTTTLARLRVWLSARLSHAPDLDLVLTDWMLFQIARLGFGPDWPDSAIGQIARLSVSPDWASCAIVRTPQWWASMVPDCGACQIGLHIEFSYRLVFARLPDCVKKCIGQIGPD